MYHLVIWPSQLLHITLLLAKYIFFYLESYKMVLVGLFYIIEYFYEYFNKQLLIIILIYTLAITFAFKLDVIKFTKI